MACWGAVLGTCQPQIGGWTEAALQNRPVIRPLALVSVLGVHACWAHPQDDTRASPFSVASTLGFPENPQGLPKSE